MTEALHAPLPLTCRQVRILRPGIQPLVAPVLRVRQHAPQRRWVAGELVGDDHPRRVVPASHRPPYEGLGRMLIPPALHEDVDDEAVLVYRPPQPVPTAVDLQSYFVQVQLVARAAATPPQVPREHR